MSSGTLNLDEKRALRLTNDTLSRFAARGIGFTQSFALSLYHYVKDGTTVCPGGACCQEDTDDIADS